MYTLPRLCLSAQWWCNLEQYDLVCMMYEGHISYKGSVLLILYVNLATRAGAYAIS